MGNTIFWSLQAQWRNVFFEFLKATNEEKLQKNLFFCWPGKHSIDQFWGPKKSSKNIISNFLLGIVIWKKEAFFREQNLQC